MFAEKFVANLRREKRAKVQKIDPDKIGIDLVTEQVRKVLKDSDQQLILMVRG